MIGNIDFQELQLVAQICLNMWIHSMKGWLSQMSLSTFGENSISSLQLGTARFIDRYLPKYYQVVIIWRFGEQAYERDCNLLPDLVSISISSKPIKGCTTHRKETLKHLTQVRAGTMQWWEISISEWPFDDLHSLLLYLIYVRNELLVLRLTFTWTSANARRRDDPTDPNWKHPQTSTITGTRSLFGICFGMPHWLVDKAVYSLILYGEDRTIFASTAPILLSCHGTKESLTVTLFWQKE